MAERLRPGLIMGRDLARPGAWIPLIRAGTRLTPEVINRVRSMGLEESALDCVDWLARVLAEDPETEEDGLAQLGKPARSGGAASRRMAEPAPFLQGSEIEVLQDALLGNCLPEVLRKVVNGISRRLGSTRAIPDYRLNGVHLLRHPMNVLTLSTVLGHSLGYEPEQLFALATGALLHEVTAESLEGNDGLARLASIGTVRDTIRLFSSWHQGTGPLRPPAGNRPPHPAEVLAVADVYDTMLSDRPDTTRMPPGIAFCALKAMAGRRLEPRTVKTFAEHVLPYPVGIH